MPEGLNGMTIFNECFKIVLSYKCIAISKITFQNKENKFNDVAKRVRQRCEEGDEGRQVNGGGETEEREEERDWKRCSIKASRESRLWTEGNGDSSILKLGNGRPCLGCRDDPVEKDHCEVER